MLPTNVGQVTPPKDWGESLVDVFSQLEEQFAWATGAPLRGVNCYQTDGGWLLVLKTFSTQRGALVAFYGGAKLADCVEQMHYDLFHNPGITWKTDKYAK